MAYRPPSPAEIRRIDDWLRRARLIEEAMAAHVAGWSYGDWVAAHPEVSRFDAMVAWQAAAHLQKWQAQAARGLDPLMSPSMTAQVQAIAARYDQSQRLLALAVLVGLRLAAAIAARR